MPAFAAPIRRGFSLVELVVVMLIISMVAAIGMPRYAAAAQRFRADAAARRVAADLQYVRNNARACSMARTIVFNVTGSSYQAAGIADPVSGGTSYAVSLGAEPYKAFLVSANFGGSSTLSITGFGVPGASGSVVLQVGVERRRIALDSESGETTITVEYAG